MYDFKFLERFYVKILLGIRGCSLRTRRRPRKFDTTYMKSSSVKSDEIFTFLRNI